MNHRRGRGEGSITQRTDGRWMARVDLGWKDSRRARKTLYGRTRREVADALTRALEKAAHGALVADERQTLGQFLETWLTDVVRQRVRPRTFTTYEAAVTRHIVPHLGKQAVAKLTAQHAQAWLATLEGAGVPTGRRRYARVVLRAALNTARRWGLVAQNVATLVDAPRVVSREIQPLSPAQAKRLLAAAADGPLHAFVAVALGCGLRLGESLGLKWADIDLDAGTLHVRRALQRYGGDPAARRPLLKERSKLSAALRSARATAGDAAEVLSLQAQLAAVRQRLKAIKTSVHLVEPKSSRSRRTIALPQVAIAALRSHRAQQLKTRLAAGASWREQDFVFTTPVGTPCDQWNLHKRFKALLAGADLPPLRIHDLRHSCATLLLAQGVNPRVVMETLGHSQISLTLNTYSHVLPALQREAAAKMDAALGKS
jgi:integrase